MRIGVFPLTCLGVLSLSTSLLVAGMEADLYLNKDKFGEFFKLEISEKGCTNVPLNWENQAMSVDTHGSCIKFYDLPYCRGKYVAMQPYHGTFQDNLETLGFNRSISAASPCGPKVPTGRYYIQNGADGSVLSLDTKNYSAVLRAHPFKPYISKGQQFQVEKISLADYEIIPRIHQNLNPLTYDMSISTSAHPVRRAWRIQSVYRGRYIIKNEWSNRCLYKSDSGKVDEHECVSWSPNQEWIFRSIKVKPYFPSKDELKNKPLLPDANLAFEPQDDAFSAVPFQPNQANRNRPPRLPNFPALPTSPNKNKKGGKPPVQVQRPGPLVITPGEPFPPVFPFPILPKVSPFVANSKKVNQKPPVPQVRHPGPLPFPAEPVVLDPKKPTVSPLDTFNIFGSQLFPNPLAAKDKKKPTQEEKNKKKDEKTDDENSDEEQSDEEGKVGVESEEDEEDNRSISLKEETKGKKKTSSNSGPLTTSNTKERRDDEDDEAEDEDEEEEDEDYEQDDHKHHHKKHHGHGHHDHHDHGHGPGWGWGINPDYELEPYDPKAEKEFYQHKDHTYHRRKKQEVLSGVKYSDYRLWF